MKYNLALCLVLGLASFAWSQDKLNKPDKPEKAPVSKLGFRYGRDVNLERYPQKTPQEAVQSAVKAIYNQRVDYLLAHLADPEYVDDRVERYKEFFPDKTAAARTNLAFQKIVKETTAFYFDDADRVADLRKFAREGEWNIEEDHAVGTHKKIAGKHVYLRLIDDRWFLDNRQKN